MRRIVMAAAILAASAGGAPAQDVAAGEQSFKSKCLACHSVGEDAKNKVGPVLNGLDGRKTGSIEGFNYSDANKSADIIWSDASFKEYIKDPRSRIPGTKMIFVGIKNEDEAGSLWAYLKQFGPNGSKK